jgi:hypothetical protein
MLNHRKKIILSLGFKRIYKINPQLKSIIREHQQIIKLLKIVWLRQYLNRDLPILNKICLKATDPAHP